MWTFPAIRGQLRRQQGACQAAHQSFARIHDRTPELEGVAVRFPFLRLHVSVRSRPSARRVLTVGALRVTSKLRSLEVLTTADLAALAASSSIIPMESARIWKRRNSAPNRISERDLADGLLDAGHERRRDAEDVNAQLQQRGYGVQLPRQLPADCDGHVPRFLDDDAHQP